jgi:hypothetical protein
MQYIEPLFNASLLSATAEEKRDYFDHKTIAHAHLKSTRQLALDSIDRSSAHRIVAVVGPAGVGKSLLARRIWEAYQPGAVDGHLPDDAQRTPSSIVFDAPSHAGKLGKTYWATFLKLILQGCGARLFDERIFMGAEDFRMLATPSTPIIKEKSVEMLLIRAINGLQQRRTKVVVIDRAERLFPEGDRASCLQSQQMLSDLASSTNTRFVLVGGYQVVRQCVPSVWLLREHIVHFRRYESHDPQEYAYFETALRNLLAHMPLDQRLVPLSADTLNQLHKRTVGCIGLLKEALLRAYQSALFDGTEIGEALILECAPHNNTAQSLTLEAFDGEALLVDSKFEDLERVYNREAPPVQTPPAKTPAGNTRPKRIGERNPSRDPVRGGPDAKRA